MFHSLHVTPLNKLTNTEISPDPQYFYNYRAQEKTLGRTSTNAESAHRPKIVNLQDKHQKLNSWISDFLDNHIFSKDKRILLCKRGENLILQLFLSLYTKQNAS